jgi:YggT family protein
MQSPLLLIYTILNSTVTILIWVIIIQSLLSFIMPPDNAIRQALDGVVNPLLSPIRRYMPQTGGLDFSPMVLIFILWILQALLRSLLVRF